MQMVIKRQNHEAKTTKKYIQIDDHEAIVKKKVEAAKTSYVH